MSEIDYWQAVKKRLYQLMLDENYKIGKYGKERGIQLGTTVSVVLMLSSEKYIVLHIGDSRIYCMNDQEIRQITEDQTIIASEIKAGRLTPKQAETDPRRNVLLQCVGASPRLQPVLMQGRLKQGLSFLLCTDGFRRKVISEEIHDYLRPGITRTEEEMKNKLIQLTELSKERQEQDNISSILIKVV